MATKKLCSHTQRFLRLTDDRDATQYSHQSHKVPPKQTSHFQFSALPTELRLEVYGHVFAFQRRSTLHDIFCKSPWVVPALGVCSEMRNAGFRIIFAHTELHLDIVSYQFASFETIATSSDPSEGLHYPLLALDRRTMEVNPSGYGCDQFYDHQVLPLPSSLFRADLIRNVSITIYLSLYRDVIESISMKIVFKMLFRLTHKLMPNLDRICLRVRADHDYRTDGRPGLTSSLLASSSAVDACYFTGDNAEERRMRWLLSLPSQIGKLPVKVRELELDGVDQEVFEVMTGCIKTTV